MTPKTSPHVVSTVAAGTELVGQRLPKDRRRYKRLPVTVTARVFHGETSYRTEILDVSEGGMLLAPIDGLRATAHDVLHIDSAPLGRIAARVVCVSRRGLHVMVELSPSGYQAAIERLSSLTRVWTHTNRR